MRQRSLKSIATRGFHYLRPILAIACLGVAAYSLGLSFSVEPLIGMLQAVPESIKTNQIKIGALLVLAVILAIIERTTPSASRWIKNRLIRVAKQIDLPATPSNPDSFRQWLGKIFFDQTAVMSRLYTLAMGGLIAYSLGKGLYTAIAPPPVPSTKGVEGDLIDDRVIALLFMGDFLVRWMYFGTAYRKKRLLFFIDVLAWVPELLFSVSSPWVRVLRLVRLLKLLSYRGWAYGLRSFSIFYTIRGVAKHNKVELSLFVSFLIFPIALIYYVFSAINEPFSLAKLITVLLNPAYLFSIPAGSGEGAKQAVEHFYPWVAFLSMTGLAILFGLVVYILQLHFDEKRNGRLSVDVKIDNFIFGHGHFNVIFERSQIYRKLVSRTVTLDSFPNSVPDAGPQFLFVNGKVESREDAMRGAILSARRVMVFESYHCKERPLTDSPMRYAKEFFQPLSRSNVDHPAIIAELSRLHPDVLMSRDSLRMLRKSGTTASYLYREHIESLIILYYGFPTDPDVGGLLQGLFGASAQVVLTDDTCFSDLVPLTISNTQGEMHLAHVFLGADYAAFLSSSIILVGHQAKCREILMFLGSLRFRMASLFSRDAPYAEIVDPACFGTTHLCILHINSRIDVALNNVGPCVVVVTSECTSSTSSDDGTVQTIVDELRAAIHVKKKGELEEERTSRIGRVRIVALSREREWKWAGCHAEVEAKAVGVDKVIGGIVERSIQTPLALSFFEYLMWGDLDRGRCGICLAEEISKNVVAAGPGAVMEEFLIGKDGVQPRRDMADKLVGIFFSASEPRKQALVFMQGPEDVPIHKGEYRYATLKEAEDGRNDRKCDVIYISKGMERYCEYLWSELARFWEGLSIVILDERVAHFVFVKNSKIDIDPFCKPLGYFDAVAQTLLSGLPVSIQMNDEAVSTRFKGQTRFDHIHRYSTKDMHFFPIIKDGHILGAVMLVNSCSPDDSTMEDAAPAVFEEYLSVLAEHIYEMKRVDKQGDVA